MTATHGNDIIHTHMEQLKDIFSSNLESLIDDFEIKEHIVTVLCHYAHSKSLPIKLDKADSVIINDYFELGAGDKLIQIADSYLFLCGFFPEYVSRKNKSRLGIEFYINKGISAYNYALSISYQSNRNTIHITYNNNGKELKPSLISRLSETFFDNTKALITLRKKLRGVEIIVDPELLEELREVIGYTPEMDLLSVIPGGSNYKVKERYVLKNNHLKRIK